MAEDVRVPARVAAGAAWLDANRADWLGDIDLITLDLGDQKRCVLAQIYGGYWRAPAEFVEWNNVTADLRAAERGFFAYAEVEGRGDGRVDAEYAELTEAWRDLIERRIAERIAAGVAGDGA